MVCCTLLYVHSSIAIILMGKRELVALLDLPSLCLVKVEWLFLVVPWGCLRFVIVAFPYHTHLPFLMRRLSLIGIDAIWQLSLRGLLMRTIASFLRYTGYLNFIKRSYKSRFIANSSSCTSTELSILFTSYLTAIKNHVIKYCTTAHERNGKKIILVY